MQLQSVKALHAGASITFNITFHCVPWSAVRSATCLYMQKYLRGSVQCGMGASDQMARCMSAVCIVFAQWADSMLVHAVLKHVAFACHMHEVLVTQHCQETSS